MLDSKVEKPIETYLSIQPKMNILPEGVSPPPRWTYLSGLLG